MRVEPVIQADQIGPAALAGADFTVPPGYLAGAEVHVITRKAAAERANWLLAHTWADNLGLEYAGIDLADCLEYNVLSVLGGIVLQHLEQGVSADGQQSSA